MNRVRIAIAVAEHRRDCVYEIAATCRALGFTHTSTLADFGVFLGSAEVDHLSDLKAVPGVIAVALHTEPDEEP